jgi:hypothetical protein
MPTARQLLVVCGISAVCAVSVVLVMHWFGMGEHAVVAAAVSAGSASAVAMTQLGKSAPDPEP